MKSLTKSELSSDFYREKMIESLTRHIMQFQINSDNPNSVDSEERIGNIEFLTLPQVDSVSDIDDQIVIEGRSKVELSLQTYVHTNDEPELEHSSKIFSVRFTISTPITSMDNPVFAVDHLQLN